jgi:type II secretion system protein H
MIFHRASARSPSRSNRGRGFTLIELMIVVGILGVAAALATPTFTTAIRRARVEAQAKRVTMALHEARNLARNSQRCVRVIVTAPEINFQAYTPGNADCSVLGAAVGDNYRFTFRDDSNNLRVLTFTPITFDFNNVGGIVGNVKKQVRATSSTRNLTVEIWPAIGTVRKL